MNLIGATSQVIRHRLPLDRLVESLEHRSSIIKIRFPILLSLANGGGISAGTANGVIVQSVPIVTISMLNEFNNLGV